MYYALKGNENPYFYLNEIKSFEKENWKKIEKNKKKISFPFSVSENL